jgi:phosphatidylglycerol:prolipoprotein diacylglycerol transferase
MGRILLHLCGPFAIYSYGLFIAIAASLFLYFVSRDPRFKMLNLESSFSSAFFLGIISVLLGGRMLHLLTVHEDTVTWIDFISFWEPGFAVLGSIAALVVFMPMYLFLSGIPILPFGDLVATYGGVLQGVARLGCFFAGCCFGCQTTVSWAIAYSDPDTVAPLYILVHPVQLYSAALLLLIFAWMYYVGRYRLKVPGQQTAVYLMLSSLERFITDFWRGDRDFISWFNLPFSMQQWIAVGLFVLAIILYWFVTRFRRCASV